MNRTRNDLKLLQSLPLEIKVAKTKQRIREWVDMYGTSGVFVSFSGGKDSTVLKHIVDSMYDNIPSLFVNTGLEYIEIQKFAMSQKNVIAIRPEMRFDEVLKTYGYPVISKAVSHNVKVAKRNPDGLVMKKVFDPKKRGQYAMHKWSYLLDAPFDVSENCCDIMKKKPLKKYMKETGRKPIIGTLADESHFRYQKWLKYGCNAFDQKEPQSQPLSFWTEQDILHYLKKYDVPYCSVYGDIVVDRKGKNEATDILKTTGVHRTGCIFCMFGVHLEKEPNRFQMLKETDLHRYEYCIGGGKMVDGKWKPSKEGLGLGKVLDYVGVKYD